MATFVVHGCKSANQKCAALVTAADAIAALVAAAALGVTTLREGVSYGTAVQVQAGDMSVPDCAFYGDAIGNTAPWPTQERGG